MRILKLLKEVSKDFVKNIKISLKELGLCILTLIMIMLFIGVISVIPAIILHHIWFDKVNIDDLSFAIVLSEYLIAIVVGLIIDFIKYIKRKWKEIK